MADGPRIDEATNRLVEADDDLIRIVHGHAAEEADLEGRGRSHIGRRRFSN